MEKVVNYVRNGKGVGLLFILASSILVTIMTLLAVKSFYGEARPQFLMVAEDFLPITVKDGKIIEPADTYKRVELDLGEKGSKDDIFSVVLDTRENTTVLSKGENGLYIYKDAVHLVSPREVRVYNLQDGVWNRGNIEQLIDSSVGIIFGLVAIVLIGVLFIVLLFKTFIAALIGSLAQKITSKENSLDMPALMRLCAIGVSTFELLLWGGKFIGIYFTSLHLFIIVVVLELLFIFKMNTNEN